MKAFALYESSYSALTLEEAPTLGIATFEVGTFLHSVAHVVACPLLVLSGHRQRFCFAYLSRTH